MKRLLTLITLALTLFAHGQKSIETDANAKAFWENLANIPTAPLDAATKASLRTVIGLPSEVKSASFAAVDLGNYVATATLTVTDPTPTEGARFSVLVTNGTATIGGAAYSVPGTIVERVYRSASWTNYSYQVASTFEVSGAAAAAQAAEAASRIAADNKRPPHESTFNVLNYGAVADGATTGTDNTAAFNSAIAAAFNAGGGTVWIPAGHYKFTGALDALTNSVLTCPRATGVTVARRTIRIQGEGLGYMSAGYQAILPGGTVLDFTAITPSGTKPSAIAFSPYVENPTFENIATEWNDINVEVDGFTIVNGLGVSAINAKNVFMLKVGDRIACHVQATGPPVSLLEPAIPDPSGTGSCGIIFPAILNGIIQDLGSCYISGYETLVVAGEHLHCKRPSLIFGVVGLNVPLSSHLISGDVSVENCAYGIYIGGACTVDLRVQCEIFDGSAWFDGVAGLFEFSGAKGVIRYCSFNKNGGAADFPVAGGLNAIALQNLKTGEWTRTITSTLRIATAPPAYASDAAAAADSGLPSGNTYVITGETILRRKP